MPNVAAAIAAHNKAILSTGVPLEQGGCNCTQNECPLGGNCLTPNVLYEATLTANIENYGENCIKGIKAATFKEQ